MLNLLNQQYDEINHSIENILNAMEKGITTTATKKRLESVDKHKAGFCEQKQKGVYKDDKCDLYKSRPQKEKTVTVEHIDIAMKDLEELVQIFYNCDY